MKKYVLLMLMAIVAIIPTAQARLDLLTLPDDIKVSSIYMPTVHQNVGWLSVKGYSVDALVNVLQSAQAKVNAEKYADGKWVKLEKKEFIDMLKTGKIKSQLKMPASVGTSKMTRKPVYSGDAIGNCQSIFNPIGKSSISLRDWKRMSPKAQQEILSHPYTKRYLEKCRGA